MAVDEIKILAQNKKAGHEYFIEEKYEAGIVLSGTEVKSVRMGKVNLKDSFARVENNEVYVYNMHISPYEKGNIFNKDPLRTRKLLLNKYEINKLIGYVTQKGYTLIPIKVYLKHGLVKVELAVAKGKKLFDKREDIASKDAKREVERHFKEKQYY
ncbi:MAG: SsrA-binding protein SmpB [Thermoanaerobacteraceae bacterium]